MYLDFPGRSRPVLEIKQARFLVGFCGFFVRFPVGSVGFCGYSHRNPVGMGWGWVLKFHSHGNPGDITNI